MAVAGAAGGGGLPATAAGAAMGAGAATGAAGASAGAGAGAAAAAAGAACATPKFACVTCTASSLLPGGRLMTYIAIQKALAISL